MSSLSPQVAPFRKADYPVDPIYLNRWSPRSFAEKDVPEETLFTVLEAARWAPSAFNLQPWKFIVAKTKEDRERFAPFIGEFNQAWCLKAPVLILIVSQKTWEKGDIGSHSFDTGAAWGYLSLEATRQGLATHAMTGIDFDKAREIVGLPDDYAVQALVALGYQGPKENLPAPMQEREQPSPRNPIRDSVFQGVFGSK
nr:nitroreductase family protein [Cohnella algarum]